MKKIWKRSEISISTENSAAIWRTQQSVSFNSWWLRNLDDTKCTKHHTATKI